MKIKLDENIPVRLRNILGDFGHQVDTVPDEGLQGRIDSNIWAATQDASAFLITQDLDFSDIRQFRPGTHHGIMLVRLRDPGAGALAERIRSIFESEAVVTWQGCLVIATERKIRVRRPDA